MLSWLRTLVSGRRERALLVENDAAELVARFGDEAYVVTRDRVRVARDGRTLDANRPRGHWTRVKLRVADMTGHVVGLNTATRWLAAGEVDESRR